MYRLLGFEENFKFMRYIECTEVLNSTENCIY